MNDLGVAAIILGVMVLLCGLLLAVHGNRIPACERCRTPFPDGYFAIDGSGRLCCRACSQAANLKPWFHKPCLDKAKGA